ncbi:class I tRNA ligase family protein, partial [Patescibacteria group bacterium]|nr:class I tRNA ligase family protein [Patescibacteria group bacterium]
SIIWAFKQLYDKDLVYEGAKTLLYCTRCGTPISKFEIAQDNSYALMKDPAVTVKFPIVSEGRFAGTNVLAWTTTPWTLPSNRALVVDPKETYVEFENKTSGQRYLAALKRLEAVLGDDEARVVRKFKGQELLGLSYQPPYDYYPPNKNDFKIYAYSEMVNMEEGTGTVHRAPGFGEIDTQMGIENGLTLMMTIDDAGNFLPEVKKWAGVYVKKADLGIIEDLKKRGLLFKHEQVTHRYPFCHRCETPLIYRSVKAWFINIQKIKRRMLSLNQKINWVPAHFKDGRFKNTIETAPDWCVSRTRYWATVMPIWRCEKCQELRVVGSIKEIEENSIEKVKVTDLHRAEVDPIKFRCSCGGVMGRIPEVLDCWFESGSMPYAQRHYPFENKKEFEESFPADYIAEYVGQLRTWFYYLLALSTALFDTNSFKNVVVTGVMAGTDGRKMSKSYGNYPDPKGVLEKYGGDALRLYLMGSPLMTGEDINITRGEELVEQIKTIILPFWNSCKFWVSFANLHAFVPKNSQYPAAKNILNQWVIARTKQFVHSLDKEFCDYQLPNAVRLIRPFIDDLSTWYIRRSKEPFRQGNKESLQTLYAVLLRATKAICPVIPF